MWKFNTFLEFAFYVLLLLALPPVVNSNETPTPRMCAVCWEKYCATGVRSIFPAGGNTTVWEKAKSPTGIQNCTMENLKPDAPCKMANGSLVLQANETHHFEGIDTYGVRDSFKSKILPCADLNLPFKPSLVTKAPIHDMPNPAAPNDSVADNKGIIIGSIIGIFIISIGVLIWKQVVFKKNIFIFRLYNWLRGQDRGRRQGNNRVPPHDTEHRDEIAIEIQPLNAEVANGNVNGVHREDDSVGTAGSLGHSNDSPV